MSFKKGQSGNPKGKKKGQVSKFTSSFKEALRIAFDGIGGTKNLTAWARENPTEFYKIMARLIPVEVSGSISHTMEASELSCTAQPQRWTCTCTATRWFRKPANC